MRRGSNFKIRNTTNTFFSNNYDAEFGRAEVDGLAGNLTFLKRMLQTDITNSADCATFSRLTPRTRWGVNAVAPTADLKCTDSMSDLFWFHFSA